MTCGCANVRMCKYADVRMCKCAGLIAKLVSYFAVPKNTKGVKAIDGTKLLIFSTYVF
jgi:hypothetical protein